MNVFSQIPTPGNGGMDDVKNAIAMLMQQQQQDDPTAPRQPTPEEASQLKQAGMQMMQAKGQMPGQAQTPPGPTPPTPPVANPKAPPALSPQAPSFMPGPSGQAGIPAGQPAALPETPNDQNTFVGPPLPPGMGPMGDDQSKKTFTNAELGLPAGARGTSKSPGLKDLPASSGERGRQSNAEYLLKNIPDENKSDFLWGLLGNLNPAVTGARIGKRAFDAIADAVWPAGHPGHVAGTGDSRFDKQSTGAQPDQTPIPDEATHEGVPDDEAVNAAANGPKGAPGSDEHLKHIAEKVAPDARKTADAIVASGANTPEKAVVAIRSAYHDDPELEKAIAEAKATYDQIRQVNNQPPTVVQFIGAILVGLAGGGPQVMQAILHPGAHLNAQREQMAGESLLKLQMARAQSMMHQNEIAAKQGADSMAQKRIDAQMAIANQREAGIDERSKRQDRMNQIKETIDFYRREAEKHDDAATKSIGQSKKNHIEAARQARQNAQPFMQMLDDEIRKGATQLKQPQAPQQPNAPMSFGDQPGQVSPSAARLLGMSA